MTGSDRLASLADVIPVPRIDPEQRAYWQGTTREQLLLTSCNSCGEVIWHPRPFCPSCSSADVSWMPASGSGVIYSYTIVRVGAEAEYARQMPYVLAYVELDEGPRVLTNVVGVTEEDLSIGLPVRAVFHHGRGFALTRFSAAPDRTS